MPDRLVILHRGNRPPATALIEQPLTAAGMRVCGAGARPARTTPDFGTVHGQDTLRAALAEADYVVLAAPLTRDTRGMVDAPVLAAMKPGARLINVGRGALVDENALIDHLAAGHLGAATLGRLRPGTAARRIAAVGHAGRHRLAPHGGPAAAQRRRQTPWIRGGLQLTTSVKAALFLVNTD